MRYEPYPNHRPENLIAPSLKCTQNALNTKKPPNKIIDSQR